MLRWEGRKTMMMRLSMMVCAVLVALTMGCGPIEGPGQSGGGEAPAAMGKSPAIEAFQASRRATQQDPAVLATLDAQTATAVSVSLEPAVEAARVQSVIDWTLSAYCQAWAFHAGVGWISGTSPRTPAAAGKEAAGFQAATQAARDLLPLQLWEDEWAGFEAGFLAAEAGVPGIPVEWVAEREGMLQGALDAAYLGAVKAEAQDISAALASIGPIGVKLADAENAEFNILAGHP